MADCTEVVDLRSFCFYILVVIIISSILFNKLYRSPSKTRCPPSPLSLPIIGHIHLLGSELPKSFQTLARRYGPLMQISMGSSNFLVASSAEVAKQILKTHDLNFASRFELGPVQYSIYQGTGFITGPYNNYYRFMKRLCFTKLFAGPQLNRFNHIRSEEINRLLGSVSGCCTRHEPVNLSSELTTLSNSLIFRMIMGNRYVKYEDKVREIKGLVVEMMELGAKLGVCEVFGPLKKFDLFGHGKKLTEVMWRYDGVVEKIMRDYEEDHVHDNRQGCYRCDDHDLMDILLETSRDANAEVKLTRNHIKHFILEMLIASIDTSSAALQWAMADLINHPRVFEKLREEIKSVVGPDCLIQESHVPNLPYLRAVINETLRLHSPTPLIFRESTKDCQINGYDIKAKTRIFMNLYAIMRDPDTWKDPEEFVPERFMANGGDVGDMDQLEAAKDHDFSYLPYGGGRRGCIGVAHSSMVMQATVGALNQCFDWKVKDGEKVDINVGSGFSGALARPLVCYPSAHFNPFK